MRNNGHAYCKNKKRVGNFASMMMGICGEISTGSQPFIIRVGEKPQISPPNY